MDAGPHRLYALSSCLHPWTPASKNFALGETSVEEAGVGSLFLKPLLCVFGGGGGKHRSGLRGVGTVPVGAREPTWMEEEEEEGLG